MIILLVIGITLVWIFGFLLSCLLINKNGIWEKVSLGFILGIGIFTFIWFLLNWAGLQYNLLSGMGLVFGLNLLTLTTYRIRYKKWAWGTRLKTNYFRKLSLLEKIGLGILIFLAISAFIQNLYWPIHYWDSIVLYDFRAKLFAQTGLMQAAISQGYFFGYPLLTSLAHTWVYVLGFGNPSFLYSLIYISFLVNFFINVKKIKLSRLAVIILTILIAISPRLFEHTQWAYTNLPYTIYIVLGSIYLYWGMKNKDIGSYLLSAILMGLSTWTRSTEPFWLAGILMAIYASIFLKKWLWPFLYIGLVGLLMIPWRAFQSTYKEGTVNVVSQVASVSSAVVQNIKVSVLQPTINFFMVNVIQMYMIYFVLLIIIVLIKILIRSKEWFFTLLVFANFVMTFAGTLIFVKYVAYYQGIPDSLSRMVMFIPPLIIFLLAELLLEIKKR